MKICTKCKTLKPLDKFCRNSKSSDGHFYQCKSCCSEYNKNYRNLNRYRLIDMSRKYYKLYYERNKDNINNKHKENYYKFGKSWKPTRKKYYENNKEHLLDLQRERLKDPNIRKSRNATCSKRDKWRRENDTSYRIKKTIRTRVWNALKGICKSESTEELLGCSFESLKLKLESQFLSGMSWENYGKWHIDHIKPCSSFDLSKDSEQKKCFHHTNLQPMWASDNILKSNKIT